MENNMESTCWVYRDFNEDLVPNSSLIRGKVLGLQAGASPSAT